MASENDVSKSRLGKKKKKGKKKKTLSLATEMHFAVNSVERQITTTLTFDDINTPQRTDPVINCSIFRYRE